MTIMGYYFLGLLILLFFVLVLFLIFFVMDFLEML